MNQQQGKTEPQEEKRKALSMVARVQAEVELRQGLGLGWGGTCAGEGCR